MSIAREIVYLVDDDVQILSGIATFLRDKHFEVLTFSSGSEFIASFPLMRPAVIVLDMHMPDITGLEIQAKLLELGNQSPVFFLSGESKSQQIIDALKGGAYEFFLKPVSPAVLLKALNRAFEIKHKEDLATKALLECEDLVKKLTPVEQEIARYFLHGHSNKMVAETIGLKPDTIKKRRAQIYEKLQVENLPDLIDKFLKVLA